MADASNIRSRRTRRRDRAAGPARRVNYLSPGCGTGLSAPYSPPPHVLQQHRPLGAGSSNRANYVGSKGRRMTRRAGWILDLMLAVIIVVLPSLAGAAVVSGRYVCHTW